MTDELQIQIDRFIDNELDAESTSELLQQCEANPSNWRRVALGLVEAREVQHALREMMDEPITAPRVGLSQRLRTVAFSLLLASAAFLIGWFAPRWGPGVNADDVAGTVTSSDGQEEPPPVDQPARPPGSDKLSVVGYARVFNGAGSNPPVPVIAGRDLDHKKLLRQRPVVPDHIQRRYRNRGLAVSAKRRVMSLELADGQRFAIPLDELDVRFVGNNVL